MTTLRTDIDLGIDDARANRVLDRMADRFSGRMQGGVGSALERSGEGRGGGQPGQGGVLSTAWMALGQSGRSAPDRDGNQRLRTEASLYYRTPVWAGQSLSNLGSTFAGGASDPAYSVRATGQVIQGTLSMLAGGLEKLVEVASDILPPGLGTLLGGVAKGGAALVGLATNVIAQGVSLRHGRLSEIAALERPREIYRVAGGGGGLSLGDEAFRDAATYGFKPAEAAGMLASYARSSGTTPSINPWVLTLGGISPEMAARYEGMGAPGGGALRGYFGTGNSLKSALGLGQSMGLRARHLDEFLGRQTAMGARAMEAGDFLDLDAVNSFAFRSWSAGQDASAVSGGPNVFGGSRSLQAAGSLQGMAYGAADSFAGMFSGLGQMAMLSEAFRNSTDPLEAIAFMQRAGRDPDAVRMILKKNLGGYGAAMAMSGQGIGATQARILGGELPDGTWSSFQYGADAGNLPYSGRIAGNDLDMLNHVNSFDRKSNMEILDAAPKIEDIMLNFSNMANKLIEVGNSLADKIGELTRVSEGGP